MIAPSIRRRRLGLESMFATAWAVYRRRFAPILLVTLLVVTIPSFPGILGEVLWPRSCLVSLLALLGTLVAMLGSMAVIRITRCTLEGEEERFGSALRRALSRWPSALGTFILEVIILIGLTLLLVVPGIIWGVYYSFSIYVVTLEDRGGKDALDYSKSLVEGQWWRVFGTNLVLGLPGSIPGLAFSVVLRTLFVSPLVLALLFAIANVLGALSIVAMTVYFVNLNYLKHPCLAALEPAA